MIRLFYVGCALLLALPTRATRSLADSEFPPATGTDAPDNDTTGEEVRDALYDDIAVLTETLMLVRKHYVRDTSYREILYGAINGMLQALDPHSGFLEPKAFETLREETSGSFSGIGIHVGIRNRVLTVIAPIEDSPAFRAGLQAGDRITAIEGERTTSVAMEHAVDALRGARGTAVTVTIERDGAEPFDVTIVRDDIRVKSIRGARMIRDDIGYLRLTQFNEPLPNDFDQALSALRDEGMRALVLDLRNNPGGLLSAAAAIAERLLPPGARIVTTRGRDGKRDIDVLKTSAQADGINRFPVAILMNRGSASGSEIVAGAMQDHRRALLVGERTFGKASVQNVVRLQSNPECAVRLTTAYYYTPGGRLIHETGIRPDIEVPMPPETWRRVQLKRAYDETPDVFPIEDRENVSDVVDSPLERALDALQAVLVFRPDDDL